jgi:tripeptidyl-peptidase I
MFPLFSPEAVLCRINGPLQAAKMREFLSAFAIIAFLVGASFESSTSRTIHEKRAILGRAPQKWRPTSRLLPDSIVPVRIALKQNNLDIGGDRLISISHPDSADYGKTLSAEEVTNLFAPSKQSIEAIYEWLGESGIPSSAIAHSDSKGWLAVDMTAAQAENLFSSELYEFEHPKSGMIFLRQLQITYHSQVCSKRPVPQAFPR